MLKNTNFIPRSLKRVIENAPYKLLILFLLADFTVVFLHILYEFTDIHEYANILRLDWFSIEKERGFAETFQYLKEFWIVIILLFLAIRKYSIILLSWSLLFIYILFDDALRIQQKSGYFLAHNLDFSNAFDIPAADIGQLLWAFIIGVIFLILIGAAYYLSNKKLRSVSNSLLALAGLFLFFSVIIDAVNVVFIESDIYTVLSIVEEAGEMLVMSVITWYVFYMDPESAESDLESKLV